MLFAEFIDQIDCIKAGDSIDILLHSYGGDPLAAWKLMSVLRERFSDITVLVPFIAFSAATLFALGANEIFMHPHASLGPIDPQIKAMLPNGKVHQFAYEDLGGFLHFLTDEVGLKGQQHKAALVEKLVGAVDPVLVGAAKRASHLSSQVGERLFAPSHDGPAKSEADSNQPEQDFFCSWRCRVTHSGAAAGFAYR